MKGEGFQDRLKLDCFRRRRASLKRRRLRRKSSVVNRKLTSASHTWAEIQASHSLPSPPSSRPPFAGEDGCRSSMSNIRTSSFPRQSQRDWEGRNPMDYR